MVLLYGMLIMIFTRTLRGRRGRRLRTGPIPPSQLAHRSRRMSEAASKPGADTKDRETYDYGADDSSSQQIDNYLSLIRQLIQLSRHK